MSDSAAERTLPLAALQEPPPHVLQTLALVASLDDCFVAGFAGLDGAQRRTLASLEVLFAGMTLQAALRDCNSALARSEFREQHFAALAAARSGLMGAAYDALWQQAAGALRLAPAPAPRPASPAPAAWQPQQRVLMESTRHWLMELALAGFSRLEPNMLQPFLATLEQIQADPALIGFGALLTGFLDELLAAGARPAAAAIPAQRWVDLWSRAMVATLAPQAPPPARRVRGDLHLLGCELLAHDHFASLVFWGLLQGDGETRLCRATFSRYKAPAIRGDELWLLLPRAQEALEALAGRHVLQLYDMTLCASGDLIWDAPAVPGARYDPLETAARVFAPGGGSVPNLAPLAPAQRHPLLLALPLYVRDYEVRDEQGAWRLFVNGFSLPLAWGRVHPLLGLTPDDVRASKGLLGLLRFDAGCWSLQPLALRSAAGKKGGARTIVAGDAGAAVIQKPPKNNAVSTLQERAGRLLRAK